MKRRRNFCCNQSWAASGSTALYKSAQNSKGKMTKQEITETKGTVTVQQDPYEHCMIYD